MIFSIIVNRTPDYKAKNSESQSLFYYIRTLYNKYFMFLPRREPGRNKLPLSASQTVPLFRFRHLAVIFRLGVIPILSGFIENHALTLIIL
jgi:hypothetical protein